MVLRRLAGETGNTSPVVTLITQFGGGKTHTLTALYHLANAAESFHAFIQNLTVAVTGVAGVAAVISLPRSQVEMTDWDRLQQARTEPLITLGSAPLQVPEFRAVVLGQLGEQRLDAAIAADPTGPAAHAGALDADTKGPLRDIHRPVGAAILFESSGGQVDKVAHLPELRFAIGEPEVETTTVDNAATALEASGFFIRKVGMDGLRIHHQATLRKVVSDRRAALDEETEIRPAIRKLVEQEFRRGSKLPVALFPEDGAVIQDTPRLMLVVLDPETEWAADGRTAERIAQRIRERGISPRLYPGSLVWCARKPGRELRDRVELWLAWQRVEREVSDGLLGTEFDHTERNELRSSVKDVENAARDEVWGSYRFVALAVDRSASEFPQWIADPAGRPRCRPAPQIG